MFAGILGFALFFRFIPNRLGRAILISLIFGFYAIYITDMFHIRWGSRRVVELSVIFAIAWASLVGFVFFVVYRIQDQERARKLFLRVSLVIFGGGLLSYLIFAIEGINMGFWTFLPGHICRQVGYLFPVVYFMRDNIRKWILPSLLYIGIAGGLVTILAPHNIVPSPRTQVFWVDLDTIIMHLLQVFVPVIIFATGEVRARLIHMPLGLATLLVMLLVGHIFNWVTYFQIGVRGPWAYNMNEIPDWLHPALFFAICTLAMFLICAIMIYTPRMLKKSHPQQEDSE